MTQHRSASLVSHTCNACSSQTSSQQEVSEEQRRALEVEKASKIKGQLVAVQTEKLRLEMPALQSRLESLHASKLLTDEELFWLEDVIADSLEEAGGDGEQVAKLALLAERLTSDAALARQLRRKFA